MLVELLAVTLFLWGNDAYSISATTPEFKWENYKTIAHALGGIGDKTYLNSKESFLAGYQMGCRLFEVDLVKTSDNVWVCRHSWYQSLGQWEGDEKKVLSSEEFLSRPIYGKYTPITFEDLLVLLSDYPDAFVMLDSKQYSLRNYQKTVEDYADYIELAEAAGVPDVMRQVIPEIYNQAMFAGTALLYDFPGYIYSLCVKKDISIKMPNGVPSGVADSFSSLLPTGIIITICAIIYAICHFIFNTTFAELIYSVIQIPLQGITDSFFGVIIMTVVMSLLWWTGVHGGSICGGILSPILQANMAANQKIIDSGLPLTIQNGGHIFTQQFWDNFLCMSGAGIVIGLVIYITFFAKSKSLRSLGKLSIVPNIFNINEPIIFGTPIVLNIYLLIPFVLVPLIIGISSYLLMYMGILPLFSGVMVPWTTPPIISGLLIGGWRVALWQFVMIVVSFVIYLPFIKKIDTLELNKENQK